MYEKESAPVYSHANEKQGSTVRFFLLSVGQVVQFLHLAQSNAGLKNVKKHIELNSNNVKLTDC